MSSRSVFISGSPRNGNVEFIIKKLFSNSKGQKELILLRKKKIRRCVGCLKCFDTGKCWKKDEMKQIENAMEKADIIILGTPNYFDNVPGILKDFFDRTSSMLGNKKLKGKKMIVIVVGGGKILNSKKVLNGAIKYFSDKHKMDILESFYFKALQKNDIAKIKNRNIIIEKIKCNLSYC